MENKTKNEQPHPTLHTHMHRLNSSHIHQVPTPSQTPCWDRCWIRPGPWLPGVHSLSGVERHTWKWIGIQGRSWEVSQACYENPVERGTIANWRQLWGGANKSWSLWEGRNYRERWPKGLKIWGVKAFLRVRRISCWIEGKMCPSLFTYLCPAYPKPVWSTLVGIMPFSGSASSLISTQELKIIALR